MKCGFMCVNCKATDINENRLLGKVCPAHSLGQHKVIKRAFMCQNCDCLSDCLDSFRKETCPGDLKTPPPKVTEGLAHPDLTPEKVKRELRVAELELERLQLLKLLEVERANLQHVKDENLPKTTEAGPQSWLDQFRIL